VSNTAEVIDRGKYGFVIRWNHTTPYSYESSMPDEATAKRCAACQDMGDALKKLSFMAQTSGGTAGRDEDLVKAIEQASAALAKAGIT
jgi:hypothetical protein